MVGESDEMLCRILFLQHLSGDERKGWKEANSCHVHIWVMRITLFYRGFFGQTIHLLTTHEQGLF